MMFSLRSRKWVRWTIAVCLVSAPAMLFAQEESPVEETGNRLGNVYFSAGFWVSQPVGTEFSPAATSSGSTDSTGATAGLTNLDIGHGTEADGAFEFEYVLPATYGTLSFGINKLEHESDLNMLTPSVYQFHEALAIDEFAGLRNDGLADGFFSVANTRLREWKLNYTRPAFETPRIKGEWSVGWRRVKHHRDMAAEYFNLVTGLPPLLPPLCDPCSEGLLLALTPRSDSAEVISNFEGRGISVGIDLELPLWKNKIVLEGGASVSALRGDTKASYTSTNHYFTIDDNPGRVLCADAGSCDEDYALFGETEPVGMSGNTIAVFNRIDQRDATASSNLEGVSQDSFVVDTHVGFRWRTPYRRLEVFGGFKQSRYDDVAIDIRPEVVVTEIDDDGVASVAVTGIERDSKSVTYEGFFAGVRLRLY